MSNPKRTVHPMVAWPILLFLPGVMLAIAISYRISPMNTPWVIIVYAVLHFILAIILRRRAFIHLKNEKKMIEEDVFDAPEKHNPKCDKLDQ
jgi:membrane protein implicated in regulation of membrane protease activity